MARNPDISEPVGKGCIGCGGLFLVGFALSGVFKNPSLWLLGTIGITVVLYVVLWQLYAYSERLERQGEEERRQRLLEEAREAQRRRTEAMLHRDAVRDEINYMTGPQFEKFMADLLRQKGYAVEETRATGDQGIDLIVPDLDGKRVVIQLKRWTGPVGNKAVQATFAGMAHYRADEGWIITTSSFTKSARELARSTSVRLIDGKELADWLEGLREEE